MPTDRKPKPRIKKTTIKTASSDSKFASIGKYSSVGDNGDIMDDPSFRSRARDVSKQAGFLEGDILGSGANIADSGNMGYYNYEFPVDSMELPQSRPEELRFYRIAYDRDPIVARAIDLHTEIPMSKINLEKPKCSSQEFADYVFDFYQGLVNRTRLFETFLHATREYWYIGEAFLYVEDDPDIDVCPVAEKMLAEEDRKKRKSPDIGSGPGSESMNSAWGSDAIGIPSRQQASVNGSSQVLKLSQLMKISSANVISNLDRLYHKVSTDIFDTQDKIRLLAKVVTRNGVEKTAEDPPAPPAEGPGAGGGDAPATEGADPGGDGAEGAGDTPGSDEFGDLGGGGGSAPANPFAGTPLGDQVDDALEGGGDPIDETRDPETLRMKKYLKLLEKQKVLLEELKVIKENRDKDLEIFKHLANKDYSGFDRIQLLPPENIEIQVDPMEGPMIFFKPSERQKQSYMESDELDEEIKSNLEQNGTLPLNMDPLKGSYVMHFARKKAPFEPHGRSILQRCMRTVIYRDKLRQVQTTLASRNMTPKTLITAPNIPTSEMIQLRGHIDEAKSDPDYTVIVNYECTWNEIGSEGRLLALDSEWQHTNQDLAAGLGFTPEILTGEGMYSNSRIQLEILNTTYLQFRDILSDLVENSIFKPIAMKKGFYEIDKYSRPRWIYPKIQFARMALRDSGDLYDMMFNMYSKGSLPVEIILEFLSIDPESCRKKLEEDLFTVNDNRFDDFKSNFYSTLASDPRLLKNTDIFDRISKNLGLKSTDSEDEEGLEGTGEGAH